MNKGFDLIGQVFGRLTVLRKMSFKKWGKSAAWECLCECGNTAIRSTTCLTKEIKPVRSCGCLAKNNAVTHGQSNTPEYRTYRAMKTRCLNSSDHHFPDYGGRGIKICDRWLGKEGFENFFKDLGPRPKGLSLERKKVNGNYEPENCVWATALEQHKNRRKYNSLPRYSNEDFMKEYNRRFSEPEYGISLC